MSLDHMIGRLQVLLEPWTSHLIQKSDRDAIQEAITYLERVKRLEELLLEKIENYNFIAPSTSFTQKQRGANDERHYIKRFLKTGEEW